MYDNYFVSFVKSTIMVYFVRCAQYLSSPSHVNTNIGGKNVSVVIYFKIVFKYILVYIVIYRCLDLLINEYGIGKSLLKGGFPDLVMHLLLQNVDFRKWS